MSTPSQSLNPVQQFAIALTLHRNAVERRNEHPSLLPFVPDCAFGQINRDVIVFARMARRYATVLRTALSDQREYRSYLGEDVPTVAPTVTRAPVPYVPDLLR